MVLTLICTYEHIDLLWVISVISEMFVIKCEVMF